MTKDQLVYKRSWTIVDIYICYQQSISTRWVLVISINRSYLNKYNNKNGITT